LDANCLVETSTVIHGDRHIAFTPPARNSPVFLTTNLSVAWDRAKGHKTVGNVSFTDGSVLKVNDHGLWESLLAPASQSPQRLLFP
jgi:hypothetical protein